MSSKENYKEKYVKGGCLIINHKATMFKTIRRRVNFLTKINLPLISEYVPIPEIQKNIKRTTLIYHQNPFNEIPIINNNYDPKIVLKTARSIACHSDIVSFLASMLYLQAAGIRTQIKDIFGAKDGKLVFLGIGSAIKRTDIFDTPLAKEIYRNVSNIIPIIEKMTASTIEANSDAFNCDIKKNKILSELSNIIIKLKIGNEENVSIHGYSFDQAINNMRGYILMGSTEKAIYWTMEATSVRLSSTIYIISKKLLEIACLYLSPIDPTYALTLGSYIYENDIDISILISWVQLLSEAPKSLMVEQCFKAYTNPDFRKVMGLPDCNNKRSYIELMNQYDFEALNSLKYVTYHNFLEFVKTFNSYDSPVDMVELSLALKVDFDCISRMVTVHHILGLRISPLIKTRSYDIIELALEWLSNSDFGRLITFQYNPPPTLGEYKIQEIISNIDPEAYNEYFETITSN